MVSTSSLQDRLVNPSSSSHQPDHGPVGAGDDLLVAGGQLDPGPVGVGVVGDHGGVVAAGPGQLAAVPGLLLQVADDGSLGHVANGHHIADGDLGLLAAVDRLAGVHALASNEQLLLDLVSVGITEVDDGKGSATAWVMDDVLDNSLQKINIKNCALLQNKLLQPILIILLQVRQPCKGKTISLSCGFSFFKLRINKSVFSSY